MTEVRWHFITIPGIIIITIMMMIKKKTLSEAANITESVPLRQEGEHPPLFATKT